MQRKERNKILMVLSDGHPALQGYNQGSPSYYLEQVVKDIEDNSPIHLCAIGINSESVKDFYSNYKVINKIEELAQAVLETLQTNLLTT